MGVVSKFLSKFKCMSEVKHTNLIEINFSTLFSASCWLVKSGNRDEHFKNVSEEKNCWLYFGFRVLCFNRGRYNGDINSFGANQMAVRDHRNISV
jgi:hypothetical protein